MFGIDDVALGLLGAAGISSAASVVGGYMGASENAAINQANMKYNAMAQVNAQQFNQASQLEAQRFNAQQALLNRQFQEKMSNSSYQRAMADLKEADLNPMLVISNGGASVPSGSSASSPSTSSPALGSSVIPAGNNISQGFAGAGNAIAGAANTALNAVKTFNDKELNEVRKGMLQSSTAINHLQAELMSSGIGEAKARELCTQIDEAARFEAMTGVKKDGVHSLISTAGKEGSARYNNLVDMYKEQIRVGKYMPAMNLISQGTGAVKDAASAYGSVKGANKPPFQKITNFYP